MDTLKKYDATPIVSRVLELVKEFPEADYIHAECLYTKGEAGNGRCGCLIGQAIVDVYPEFEKELKRIDKDRGMTPLFSIMKMLGIECSGQQQRFLERVQGKQDNGEPWGCCVTDKELILIKT